MSHRNLTRKLLLGPGAVTTAHDSSSRTGATRPGKTRLDSMAFPFDSTPYYIGMQGAAHPPGPPPPYSAPPPAALAFTPAMGPPAAGCPPGLEYLAQIDRVLVRQKVNYGEMITGWEMSNQYVVTNGSGQQIFTASEDSDFFMTHFFGPLRPFNIHVRDNAGREVLTVVRPLKYGSCCCPCCLQEVEVQSPSGVRVGHVVQDWHPLLPKFTVSDATRRAQLKIKGPCCDCRCFSDVVFEVLSRDEGAAVGRISKQWAGVLQEGFTDADNFGVSFPMDLDVNVKAVLLGAVFLIDFMYFETNKKTND